MYGWGKMVFDGLRSHFEVMTRAQWFVANFAVTNEY